MAVAIPSLLSLAVSARRGRVEMGTATAFVARRRGADYLVTNWHVATGRNPSTGAAMLPNGGVPDRLAVLHHTSAEVGRWEFRTHKLYDSDEDPLWLEHPLHGRKVDVVALPITSRPRGARLLPYDLDHPWPRIVFGPSNAVSIIGFPFAISGGGGLGVWVQGTMATEPELDYRELPLMLVDSRTREGQSGSPVIVYRSDGYATKDGSIINNGMPAMRPIGVYSGRINKESDLGFVWKLSALIEIIDGQRRAPLPTLAGSAPSGPRHC